MIDWRILFKFHFLNEKLIKRVSIYAFFLHEGLAWEAIWDPPFQKNTEKEDHARKVPKLLSKIDVNGVAMAPYSIKLIQDRATDHINLLETYLALYKPPGIKNEGLGGKG